MHEGKGKSHLKKGRVTPSDMQEKITRRSRLKSPAQGASSPLDSSLRIGMPWTMHRASTFHCMTDLMWRHEHPTAEAGSSPRNPSVLVQHISNSVTDRSIGEGRRVGKSQSQKGRSVCLKVPGCYGVSVLPRPIERFCSHGSLDVTDVARPAVSAYGQHCRPERSEQARMLGFASLGCVTRRDKPTSRDGDGGSLRLGPCELGTAGPAGQQHFRIDKFGPQGQQKILKCCHAGPAPPVQQINQVCCQY